MTYTAPISAKSLILSHLHPEVMFDITVEQPDSPTAHDAHVATTQYAQK